LIKNVKAICLQTTSFSWIDVEHAKSKNIPVLNLRGFSQEAVAEYSLLLALGVARKLALLAQSGYLQDFINHRGIELKGKTAGIIGLGRIGGRIAELVQGIGMITTYWSHTSRDVRFEYKDLVSVIEESDVIFVCLAQNKETDSILTDEILQKMKPSVIFVSIAHKIYNHDLIVKMVHENKLFGYGYEEDNGNPGKHTGNIYSLPALGWATNESVSANANMWTDSMISASVGEFINQVS